MGGRLGAAGVYLQHGVVVNPVGTQLLHLHQHIPPHYLVAQFGSMFLKVAQTGTAHQHRGHLERLGEIEVPPHTQVRRVAQKIGRFHLRVGQQGTQMDGRTLGFGMLRRCQQGGIMRLGMPQHLAVMGLRAHSFRHKQHQEEDRRRQALGQKRGYMMVILIHDYE